VTALSRRNFLKLGASALLGLAFKPLPPDDQPHAELGRVTIEYLRVHQRPTPQAKQVGWKGLDEVVQIFNRVIGENASWRNPAWCEIEGGYVESAHLQPVEYRLNPVETAFAENGFIGEITVPFTDARRQPHPYSTVRFRLHFGSIFWVRGLERDDDGQLWYKLYDERLVTHYYTPARAVRRLSESELLPISPETANKKIVVNLSQQRLTAFEGKREVFTTLISSGRLYFPAEGAAARSWTPLGNFTLERKRPSRHMGNGEFAGSDYELPGVPWVSYFHWKGFAFHGAWWHNDFGYPRSAGCINMRPEEARWLYRWTHPIPLPGQELTTGQGTTVEIVES
jgi:hypothetical protein